MATIHIELSRIRIFRRMGRAESRIAYLETRMRELSEELTRLSVKREAIGERPANAAEAARGGASVQQIMDEYLNFPDERRETSETSEQEGEA